jgi:hypothetical protein
VSLLGALRLWGLTCPAPSAPINLFINRLSK